MRALLVLMAVLSALPSAAQQPGSERPLPDVIRLAQAAKGDAAQKRNLPSTRPQEDLSKSRAWIGITAVEISPAVARQRGAPGDFQVMITQLVPNGPAANGGLRPNDIILRVNNVNTLRLFDVSAQLNVVPHGETAEVVVLRNRKELRFNVSIIRLALTPEAQPNQPPRQQRD